MPLAISFGDSLKKSAEIEAARVAEASVAATIEEYEVATFAMPASENGIATLNENDMIATYAGEETWTQDIRYKTYKDFEDRFISTINENKEISLNAKQYNITQEENSQYIPFEMPRKYDGIDLAKATLSIHYTTKNGTHSSELPINVTYSNDKIRFGWLVGHGPTIEAGRLQFEIQAWGYIESEDNEQLGYIWKTKPNNEMVVLESLCNCEDVITSIDNEGWIQELVKEVANNIAKEIANVSIGEQVLLAEQHAEKAEEHANEAKNVVETAQASLEATIDEKIRTDLTSVLLDYYTEDEVDALLDSINNQLKNVTQQIETLDGLANFNVSYDGSIMTFWNGNEVMKTIEINSDPSAEWTAAYTKTVDDKIATAKAENAQELEIYKNTVDTDLSSIHEAIDDLPQTLQNDYYTKTVTDEKFATKEVLSTLSRDVAAVESTATTNKTDIGTLSGKIAELQTEVSAIDKSPRLTYEATYSEEQIYTLWEIEGEGDTEVRTPKGQFKIVGGGGSATSSVLKIEYVTKTPYVATKDATVELSYIFSGVDSSGVEVQEGTATWKVGGTTVATEIISAGENKFDVTKYLSVGTQKVMLSITDDNGSLATRSWTVQVVDVRLESTFDDKLTYNPGSVAFGYTPYGVIEKTVHFEVNGEEVGTVVTSASGIPLDYTITGLTHGSHLLRTYMTAQISSNNITSNEILKDILILDEAETTPVIGCTMQNFTAKQYDTTNIQYTVYDPKTESPTVTLAIDGAIVKESKLTSSTDTWAFKSSDLGEHILTITCGETVKTLKATIVELGIDITPVTAGLAFDFNPVGYSNADTDRLWSDGDVAMTVSDNFDWINGGYQMDENGDQYFCVKAGTSATINYELFADDAKKNGKEFKLVFRSTNVARPDATFLSCMDNTTDSDHIGIQMNVHEANIYGQAGSLELSYSEEDIIEFEFNISKDTEPVPMVMGYEDGVSTRPMVYDSSYNFTQNAPQVISIGSPDCDLHIYRMKAYNTSMTDRGILNNFIADARNADAMISRYNRNQIYDENQALDPDVLAQKCPWLRVYKVSAPYFTNNKSDKVPGTTIQQIYKDGDPVLDNWTCYDCQHAGRTTTCPLLTET